MSDISDDNPIETDLTAQDNHCEAANQDKKVGLSQTELKQKIAALKAEHRTIDLEIQALIDMGALDMLKIGRMKKVKLSIKDQIRYFENQFTPDIIA